MIDEFKRICGLQPAYSSKNSEAMQERSVLIRRGLPGRLRDHVAKFAEALGPYGKDLAIGASDGMGRKTEAPWVRLYSISMSPTPREGFYVVLHFAADGSAMFVSVGCGSTIWANGELIAVSDAELSSRTDWARQVIVETRGSLNPFEDEIALGAKAPLPRTFEKATVCARRVPVGELEELGVLALLVAALAHLRLLYDAQVSGRSLSDADRAELELDALARPRRIGQGFGLTGPERRAVEDRAMDVARIWLEANDSAVENVSKNSPFDFSAVKDDLLVKVEVKGTTSDLPDAIFMTRNEVDLHRKEIGTTALLIVHSIRLARAVGSTTASGGTLVPEVGWNIDDWELSPMAYRVCRLAG